MPISKVCPSLRGIFARTSMALLFASFAAMNLASVTAKAEFDYSSDKYKIAFHPDSTNQIRLLNSRGQLIGHLSSNSPVEIEVSGDVVRRARGASGEPDVTQILSQLSSSSPGGHAALDMTMPFDVTTAEGRILSAGTVVYADMNDFVRLATSSNATSASDGFNEALSNHGVGGSSEKITRPGARDQAEVSTTVGVADMDNGEDDESDVVEGESVSTPLGEMYGAAFPSKWLSSPTCGCSNGSCRPSSLFGSRHSRRTTNGHRMSHNHKGMDISGGTGTPIVAAADGCVSRRNDNRSSDNQGYGLSIYLAHGNGYETQYSHLSRFATNARLGQCFKRGEVIGYMGATGNVTGVHLHFGLLHHRTRINPLPSMITRTSVAFSRACSELPSYDSTDELMRRALGDRSSSFAQVNQVRHSSSSQ